ncbi:NAD-dependent epimerase/dehydratase family protein [Nonomuraea sp. NPDC049152]|uniref:NAD-dependent epimerase/dehydratase family protein n=1 Tax=Nonomuraea sp. NPDC049152 TaxID=3154350 RepID=UPI0033E1A93F
MNELCVIGGSRYFGRRMVENLRDEGVAVTVINRGSSPAPEGVTHLVADRDDEEALRRALAGRSFDAVVDQICYTPRQAAIAARVFAGRTARYVMTSTIEVYAGLEGAPFAEDAVDLAAQGAPDASYGGAKRQAEAVLAAQRDFGFVSVRSGHVLGGEDFTGRLEHYVRRIAEGLPVIVHENPKPSSFIHEPEIARFLAWAARADFTGPVNAASHGDLDVWRLCAAIGRAAYTTGEDVSPYSFERAFTMDTSRATGLGFAFSQVGDWLPGVVEEAVACAAV